MALNSLAYLFHYCLKWPFAIVDIPAGSYKWTTLRTESRSKTAPLTAAEHILLIANQWGYWATGCCVQIRLQWCCHHLAFSRQHQDEDNACGEDEGCDDQGEELQCDPSILSTDSDTVKHEQWSQGCQGWPWFILFQDAGAGGHGPRSKDTDQTGYELWPVFSQHFEGL